MQGGDIGEWRITKDPVTPKFSPTFCQHLPVEVKGPLTWIKFPRCIFLTSYTSCFSLKDLRSILCPQGSSSLKVPPHVKDLDDLIRTNDISWVPLGPLGDLGDDPSFDPSPTVLRGQSHRQSHLPDNRGLRAPSVVPS